MDILIDYLQFSSKIHSFADLTELLGLQNVTWQIGKSRDWLHHQFFSGIHLYYGGRDDLGVELSGIGCRMLESLHQNAFDWLGLFSYIAEQGSDMNVSRLDVAGDDKDGILTMKRIVEYTRARKYICKARRKVWISGDEEEVLWGSSRSDTRLRIYNKALERKVEGPWVRVEFQLRDDAADSFLLNLLGKGDIGQTYCGVLLNYLRYVTRCPDESQNNYDRIPTVSWWARFVHTTEKIKNIRVGGLEYNYSRLEDFIVKQCAPSLKAYLMVNNGDVTGLLEIINKATLSKKHEALLAQMRLLEEGYEEQPEMRAPI